MSVSVIINPMSGPGPGDLAVRGRARATLARELLARDGRAGTVVVSEHSGHAETLAREACATGASLVIAWGGDGTTNEVGRALAFGPVPLGIVPAGSGNGLARAIGLPKAHAAALLRALHGTPRRLDVGELGGRLFFNVAGAGFDARVARAFNALGRRRGFAVYLKLGLSALFGYQPLPFTVDWPGGTFSGRALMVVLANGSEFGNGARIAPAASPDDGELDLVVVEATTPLGDVLRARFLFDGSIARRRGITTVRVTSATIAGPTPLLFHVDGETAEATGPLTARIHPGAIVISC